MKKLLIAIVAVVTLQFVNAQTWKSPQTSTTQTIKQNFALASIEITYSRPGTKGRKIFGDLVPFNKIWRTGANNANELIFADTVFINGVKINPGKYGLVSIPHEKSWTLIVTKQLNVTDDASYKQDQDVVRVEAPTKSLTESLETFTMQFANIKHGTCDLQIMWDKTAVNLPIVTNIEERMKAQVEQLINKDTRPYFNAALYAMNNGGDLNQALVWFDKALEQEPELLRNHNQRVNCLKKLNRKAEAKASAQKGLELAKAQKNNGFIQAFETHLKELNN